MNGQHEEKRGHSPQTVSYTAKNGERMNLDSLRLNLEIIADDLDTAEVIARQEGDHELADALDALFHDVDGLTPAAGAEGVRS